MRKILFSLIFVLTSCVVAFSQTNETAPCPTLSVTGPAGIPQPDEPITFTANIGEEAKKYDLKYRWSVSNGTIVEGEETLSLKVSPKDFHGSNLTATVEVIGLPKDCSNTASETMATICTPSSILLDEFSISPSQIDKEKLNNLAAELGKNPSAQGYILEKFNNSVSKKTVEAKSRKILDYFTTAGFDKSRITVINGLVDKNLTQFFIVPAGATPPQCDDCIEAEPQ